VKARLIATMLACGLLSACATAQPTTLACRKAVTVTTQGATLALRAPVMLQKASLERNGAAVLSCRPRKGGLDRCVVLFEDQIGDGKAALSLADRVIYPADEDARTVEVRVRFDAAGAVRCG